MQFLDAISMISVHFQGKPFSITVIQVYAPTSNAEEAEVVWFHEQSYDSFLPLYLLPILFSALLVGAQTWITVILNGLPWKRTEIILSFLRLHPSTAFQTLVDYEGYSISSKGFLPTAVDIMVI